MLQLIDNPPPWPNGARCAVCIAFDFDAESLLHLNYPQDSLRRVSLSSTLRYGATVAVPRIVSIMQHFDIRQTFFIPGWCIEAYPDAVRRILEAGHEIAHHGYLHERVNQFSKEDERSILLRGMEAIDKLTGSPPVGYRCPSGAFSEHTLDLLLENGFRYDSSLGGYDIPYLLRGAGTRRLIELPYDHSSDDWPQYVHLEEAGLTMPIQSPARAMEVFQADFDAAWQYGGFWTAVWHPFVSGRPARAEAIVGLIKHMKEKGNVWFAPLYEIAEHIEGLVSRGEWVPPIESIPSWPKVPFQIAHPSR